MSHTLRQTDPRAFDAAVAEKVMGATLVREVAATHNAPAYKVFARDDDRFCVGIDCLNTSFAPHQDAEDDYRVLEHVRTWPLQLQIHFANALADIYGGERGILTHVEKYQPGCYAEAALRVVEEESQAMTTPLDDKPKPHVCDCEFTPNIDDPGEEPMHFLRRCKFCGATWYGLHCPHDGRQNPCGDCGRVPVVVDEQ